MKKLTALILFLAMCFSLSACGKSEAVVNVEELISSIGEVTLESEAAIAAANDAFFALSEEEKAQVKNLDDLDAAISRIIDLFEEYYQQGVSHMGAGEYDQGAEIMLWFLDDPVYKPYAEDWLKNFVDFVEDENLINEIYSRVDVPFPEDYGEVLRNLNNNNLQRAIECFEAQENEQAKCYSEILKLVRTEDYYEAAKLAAEAAELYPETYALRNWNNLFRSLIDYSSMDNGMVFDEWLYQEAVIGWLDEYTDTLFETIDAKALDEDHLTEFFCKNYVGPLEDSNTYQCVDSLEGLKSKCGSNPQGKVLVLRQQYDYPDRKAYCAVDKMLMRYMPPEMMPPSLDQVQYLLVYTYDNKLIREGNFRQTFGYADGSSHSRDFEADILRIDVTVELIDLSSGSVKYSKTAEGSSKPDTFYGSGDGWYCGESGKFGNRILEALKKVK